MKMTKGYVVSYGYNLHKMVFTDESDRNEMALAIHDEILYYAWAYLLNWYGEDDLEKAKRVVGENMFTYEVMIMED